MNNPEVHHEGTKDTKGRMVGEAGGRRSRRPEYQAVQLSTWPTDKMQRNSMPVHAFSDHSALRVLRAFVVNFRIACQKP